MDYLKAIKEKEEFSSRFNLTPTFTSSIIGFNGSGNADKTNVDTFYKSYINRKAMGRKPLDVSCLQEAVAKELNVKSLIAVLLQKKAERTI